MKEKNQRRGPHALIRAVGPSLAIKVSQQRSIECRGVLRGCHVASVGRDDDPCAGNAALSCVGEDGEKRARLLPFGHHHGDFDLP